jgi:hypothetical protein
MSRKQPSAERTARVFRLWSLDQAQKAVPYLRSVVTSIREQHLEAVSQTMQARRLEAAPGHSDRDRLIALEEARKAARQAAEVRDRAEEELNAIDAFCIDAVRGEAILPFIQDNQLAWYCFDLFDEPAIRTWRFHTDAPEHRRPLELSPTRPVAVQV